MRAGINRSIFYKYYSDIFDWREQIEKECLERARKVIDQINSTDLQPPEEVTDYIIDILTKTMG